MSGVLWEALAGKISERPAQKLREAEREIAYSELLTKSIALSKNLQRGTKYGILCDSELNASIAILACFAASAVAVPLSKRYGENHTNAIIESARLSRRITDSNRTPQAERFRDDLPETDDLTDTAVILCSSGTTGKPKGVKLSHANLLANIQSIQAYFQLAPDDRILIQRPLFHASALIGEFLTALAAGAQIHFFTGALPVMIPQTINQQRVTVMGAAPALCNLIFRRCQPTTLRKLAISGECLTQAVAQKLQTALPNTQLYNAYGLTEAGPRVSVLMPGNFITNLISVGRPIEGVEVKILDGELLVRGANVMQGYYNNPGATAEKLKDGWLHTGDSASIDEQGFITIHGRKDDMIIRAGMNVYPQEIENALLASGRVREALAFGIAGGIGVKAVAEGISKREILSLCQAALPSYAIPDQIEFVDNLPKTTTGKVIRRTMPAGGCS